MLPDAKRKRRKDDADRDQRDQRLRQEDALDEALRNTFPASDPVSLETAAKADFVIAPPGTTAIGRPPRRPAGSGGKLPRDLDMDTWRQIAL